MRILPSLSQLCVAETYAFQYYNSVILILNSIYCFIFCSEYSSAEVTKDGCIWRSLDIFEGNVFYQAHIDCNALQRQQTLVIFRSFFRIDAFRIFGLISVPSGDRFSRLHFLLIFNGIWNIHARVKKQCTKKKNGKTVHRFATILSQKFKLCFASIFSSLCSSV